jgi:hypothetical protein
MPTRKQRRRRQKERRHEYEFVYVDEEGREVEVDPEEMEREATPRGDGKRAAKNGSAKGRSAQPLRTVAPPSWNKVGKRALIFFPLIFIAFSLINSGQSLGTRILVTLLYTLFFIPFMYLMDRTMYRTYLKRTGKSLPPRSERRR